MSKRARCRRIMPTHRLIEIANVTVIHAAFPRFRVFKICQPRVPNICMPVRRQIQTAMNNMTAVVE